MDSGSPQIPDLAEFGIFQNFDFPYGILRAPRRSAADRSQIKAFVSRAGLAHFARDCLLQVRVLQQIEGDEFVVSGGIRIGENFGELGKMGRPRKMIDAAHRLFGEEPQCFAFDAEEAFCPDCLDAHKVRGELSIGRLVLAGREVLMVLKTYLEVLNSR